MFTPQRVKKAPVSLSSALEDLARAREYLTPPEHDTVRAKIVRCFETNMSVMSQLSLASALEDLARAREYLTSQEHDRVKATILRNFENNVLISLGARTCAS